MDHVWLMGRKTYSQNCGNTPETYKSHKKWSQINLSVKTKDPADTYMWWRRRRIIKRRGKRGGGGRKTRGRKEKDEGERGRRRRKRPRPPEDKQIQSTKCCVLLCLLTKHYSITTLNVAQAFRLVTRQLTLVWCKLLLTGKFTRWHTFSSLLVLGAPTQPELLHQKRSSILSGNKLRHI